MITLEDAKTYLRVDGTDEDTMIQNFITAADEYLAGCVKESVMQKYPAKCDMVRRLLVADYYENRTAKDRPVTATVQLLITQLQAQGWE